MGWLEATRVSYDEVAEDYQPMVWEMFDSVPLERAMLSAFASVVLADGGGPVADIGCGPGDVTAWLAGLGLEMTGIDLSPGMLAVARRNHPALDFRAGDMTDLDLPGDGLAGVVSWWSTVHLPPAEVPTVLAGFARALRPGGHLLVGFHAGDEVRHKTEAYGGHPVDLDVYLRPPSAISGAAEGAGLAPVSSLTVEPAQPGRAAQCCLLFRKPR